MTLSSCSRVLKSVSDRPRPGQREEFLSRRPPRRRACLELERLEDRTVLDAVHWVGGSGYWFDAAHWDTGRVPGPADDAIIGVAGVTVTHARDADTINSLTINDDLHDTLELTFGTLSLTSDSVIGSANNFHLSGGTLTGTGSLLVRGLFTWSAGTMSGTGSTVAQGGLIKDGAATLDERSLINVGEAAFSNSFTPLLVCNGAQITNLTGATWDLENYGGITQESGTVGTFTNQGTLEKSAGASDSAITTGFNNSGSVLVQAGTLALKGGGSDSGGFTIAAGATLAFAGGTHTLDAGASLSGDGTLDFRWGPVNLGSGVIYQVAGDTIISGGTANFNTGQAVRVPMLTLTGGGVLSGGDDVIVTGTLVWIYGTMAGTGVTDVAPGGFLNVVGGRFQNFYEGLRTVNNEGTNISAELQDVFVSTDTTYTELSSFLASGLQSFAHTLSEAYANPIPLLGHALQSIPGSIVNDMLPGLASSLHGIKLAAIGQSLFQAFGPPGLNILNGSTAQSIAITNYHGVVAITLPLRLTYSGRTPFDIGLPGLPLQLDAPDSVQDAVTIGLNLTFSVTQRAGESPAPAIERSNLQTQLIAMAPGLMAPGRLGLFNAQAADDAKNPSSVNLTYTTNFSIDTSGSPTVSTATTGSASVNLLLGSSFGHDPSNAPILTADFHVAWTFSDADPARPGGFGNTPSITFDNVQLYVGSFVGDLLAPAVADVQLVTRPLEPLAEFLLAPLPVLSDLSVATGGGPVYFADLLRFLGQDVTRFAEAIEIINGLDSTTLSAGVVHLGSFTVTDPRARDGAGNAAPADILQSNAASDVISQISALGPGAASFFADLSRLGAYGPHFTMLDSPASAFDLLLGRDTTLFRYALPPVSVSTSVGADIPVYPGVVVHFGGDVTFSASGTFRWDSSGLHGGNLLDGFALEDVSVTVGLGVTAGAGVGIPDIISLTVDGNLGVSATFTVTGTDGNARLTASQLASGQVTISTAGRVYGGLSLDVSTLGVEVFSFTLASFDKRIF
jgi:hypothetical protein